ncbi:MAG: hypothetical protein H6709_04245 [Kofleriaceae bacterium]|nr:hypothetical protein [Kofleriaceae bacterium]
MKRLVLLLGAAALAGGACGPGRTAAATQPTPAAFDPAQSDPAALEIVDASVAALGGAEHWQAIKQLQFDVKYTMDGQLKSWYRHAWDRWNGRHNFQSADLATDDGKPGSMKWMEVFYDLFDDDAKPHATYGGKEVAREDAIRFRGDARTRLSEDGYYLTLLYKQRDPGVMLHVEGEVKDVEGTCNPGCTTVKITFDPAVGKDTWYVNYNTSTKLPEVIEKEGPQGRLGFKITDWAEAGGLRWPAKIQNIGLPGEVFEFSDIKVGDPDDRLYVPQVVGG